MAPAETENSKTSGLRMYLYDFLKKDNVEEISFDNTRLEDTAVSENMQYLYSRIAEANTYFSPAGKKGKAPPSPHRIAVIDFRIFDGAPDGFIELTSMTREVVRSRSGNTMTPVPESEMTFVNMKNRAGNTGKRLSCIGRALNACWGHQWRDLRKYRR